jgi:hypothetical protein
MKLHAAVLALLLALTTRHAVANQSDTEERLMFRFRALTQSDLAELKSSRGIKLKSGVIVTDLLEGFPVKKSDLSKGDIITSIDGSPVLTPDAVALVVANAAPNKPVKVSYLELQATREVKAKPVTGAGGSGIGGSTGVTQMELIREGVRKSCSYPLATVNTKSAASSPTNPPTNPAPKTESSAAAKPFEIKSEYDKFSGAYTLSTNPDWQLKPVKYCPTQFKSQLHAVTKKASAEFPLTILGITSVNRDWCFLRPASSLAIALIIDDTEHLTITCEARDSEVFRGGSCYERLSYRLTDGLLQRLSTAKKVEAQIGIAEFEFPSHFPSGCKGMLEEIKGLSKEN